MLHQFKFAARHIRRTKVYSVIIILSLTIGFVCSNLLIPFLIAETSTDSFHKNASRIFQIFSEDPFGGTGRISYILSAVPPHLRSNYSEIKSATSVSKINASIETNAGLFNDINILGTDSSFFSIFDYPVYAGGINKTSAQINLVLTRNKAKILFGKEDVVGETVKIIKSDTSFLITVIAVFDQFPENTHLVFDAIVYQSTFNRKLSDDGLSYISLDPNSDPEKFVAKINDDAALPTLLGPGKGGYHLEPLENSYFSRDNTVSYTKTRSKLLIWAGYAACALVLFMAAFNFINLFLLSLHERRKDTGIRKTLGISIEALLALCSSEVIIYITVALIISMGVASLIAPAFNEVMGSHLSFSYVSRMKSLYPIVVMVFALGMLVIFVAVVKQKKVQPISLMKNKTIGGVSFNKLLFTLQFVISITLVICAITIVRQMKFLENAPLGFNRNLIQLNAFDNASSRSLPALKTEILKINGINNVSLCSGNPISGAMIMGLMLDNGEKFSPYLFEGDDDFVKTLNLQLVEGNALTGKEGSLVNQKLVNYFNVKNPIGAKIPGTKSTIVGVVKDFTIVSFKKEIPPVIISYPPTANNHLLVDFTGVNPGSLLPSIESAWRKIYPQKEFSYQMIQQDLIKKYGEEIFFYRLVIVFAVVGVIISCFGLFALSWAVTRSKTKEIGIRKVLGATTKDIINLLTKTFTLRIAIAFCIAMPLGYYLMNRWLSVFVTRSPFSLWIFAGAGLAVVVIGIMTMAFQTYKASISNPIEELRSE